MNLKERIFAFKYGYPMRLEFLKELWSILIEKGYSLEEILVELDLKEEYEFWREVIENENLSH